MTTAAALPMPADWRDFISLTKPRVMSLVVFTGLCGLLAAPEHIDPVLGFTAVLCIALGAGAAGALNQWYESDIDAHMKRTRGRPLPAGRMERQSALHFGVGLAVLSVVLMGLAVNLLSAAILTLSILFYVLIYTVWLKRRTPQNIVIGGAAGAFPAVIGWAAATGRIDLLPLLLFALVFLWTPPHFWSLALFVRSDYAAAGTVCDAAGGGGRAGDAASGRALHRADGRRRHRAVAAQADRRDLWRDRCGRQHGVRGDGIAGWPASAGRR